MKRTYIYLMLLMFNVQFSMFNELHAQEAFYIYRNDGDFNGFFYDDVKSMKCSKLDLEGVEHDEYVVQEIETKDSLYRIPLCAIDSIGFQQPDIIFNENFHEVNAYGGTVQTSWHGLYFADDEGYTIKWPADEESQLPTPGMVIYISNWEDADMGYYGGSHRHFDDGPFIGRVMSVTRDNSEDHVPGWYTVVCEPVDSIGEVFEQFISVERIGTDNDGYVRRHFAGMDKLKQRRRAEGQIDVTLVSLNGSFPFLLGDDRVEVGLTVDLGLNITANAAYKITRDEWYIKVDFAEDVEAGLTLKATGKMEDVTSWQVGGFPFYFPSFLPILEVRPGPGAFLKTAGDFTLSLSTPKLALHGRQSLSIGSDGVDGGSRFYTGQQDDSNNWSCELSLNGSAQTGVHMPFKTSTHSWFKRIGMCNVGVDVYAGPKLEAHFTLDPAALAGGDVYSTLGGTQIKLTPEDFVIEGNAYFKAGKKEKNFKIFDAEAGFGAVTMRLFPKFKTTKVDSLVYGYYHQGLWDKVFINFPHPSVHATIMPYDLCIPWTVLLGAYNADKKLIGVSGLHDKGMYSLWNPWHEVNLDVNVNDGTYTVCPVIACIDTYVPVWDAAATVKVERPLELSNQSDVMGSPTHLGWEGLLYVDYVLNKDDKIFINVADNEQADACFIPTLISREPMKYEDPNAEEYFERATFSYKFTDKFWYYNHTSPTDFVVTTYRTKPEVRERTVIKKFEPPQHY